jgi:aminopeptidase-like protein
MLGNEESLVLQKSFEGNTPIDDIAKESAVDLNIEIREAGFRGVCCNDELVCNGPGMRIPTVSISRSKGNYISYPEYHTDADTPENLNYDYILESVNWLEKMWDNLNEKKNQRVALINKGPIFLSGYDLWGIWGNIKGGKETFDKMMILFDGTNTLNTISKTLNLNYNQVEVIVDQLHENKLINYI